LDTLKQGFPAFSKTNRNHPIFVESTKVAKASPITACQQTSPMEMDFTLGKFYRKMVLKEAAVLSLATLANRHK